MKNSLPLKFIKGSANERLEYAKNLNASFYKKIMPKFKYWEVKQDTFVKTINKVLPSKINVNVFDVKTLNDDSVLGLATPFVFVTPSKIKLVKYDLHLPMYEDNKNIPLSRIYIFMHELTHFFYGLSSPKHIVRNVKCAINNIDEKTGMIYEDFLYSKKKPNKYLLQSIIIPNKLKNLTDSQKIDFLQNARYSLMEEKLAYKEGQKYYLKMLESQGILDSVEHKTDGSEYYFDEKIEILNDLLANELNRQRRNLNEIINN